MNRTVFAPPLDTIWRLTDAWSLPTAFMDRNDNYETLYALDKYPTTQFFKLFPENERNGQDWLVPYRAWIDQWKREHMPDFLAGTVITFDRYHISHSGDHAITLRILASPEPLLHPKKQKGKMRGAGRIYLKVDELNTLPELEQVYDFSVG